MSYVQAIGFELITPGCCNVPFLMSQGHFNARKQDHDTWWCPNCGCTRHFPAKSDKEILKEQLEAQRRRTRLAEGQAEQERHRTRAQKAAKTRLKNRIANGVCPCCNRTFKNLMQHMHNQHPEFAASEKPADVQDLIAAMLHDNGSLATPEIVRDTKADHQKVLQTLYSMEQAGTVKRAGKKGRAINWKIA